MRRARGRFDSVDDNVIRDVGSREDKKTVLIIINVREVTVCSSTVAESKQVVDQSSAMTNPERMAQHVL